MLLCLSVSSAWADWDGGTYTATAGEKINSTINVNADATLTINAGVTMTINGSIVENTKVSGNAWVEISAEDAVYILTSARLANGAYWTTFYGNDSYNFIAPEGTQVFTVSLDNTTITLNEIAGRIVEAGQGVVLKQATTASETTATITMAKTDSEPTGYFVNNALTGTASSITNPGNAYVLNYKAATGVGFYKLKASGTIGANKAYLTYPASAREFFLFDETTSISEELRVKSEEFASAVVFDLQGRRVQNPTKGLYIVNGKKVFINK